MGEQDRQAFGVGLDVEGDLLVAGEPRSDLLFVYRELGGQWVEEVRLSVPDRTEGDLLGFASKIHGNAVVAGAPYAPDWKGIGKVYVFKKYRQTWYLERSIDDSSMRYQDYFGWSMDVDDRWTAIGVPGQAGQRGEVLVQESSTLLPIERGSPGVVTDYHLAQNYPNPFNPSTEIDFTLPSPGAVRLSVYDVLGREVARLVDGVLAAGEHQLQFDASGLPAGMYLYRLSSGDLVETRRMMLVK